VIGKNIGGCSGWLAIIGGFYTGGRGWVVPLSYYYLEHLQRIHQVFPGSGLDLDAGPSVERGLVLPHCFGGTAVRGRGEALT
jgi:hypothetical protein